MKKATEKPAHEKGKTPKDASREILPFRSLEKVEGRSGFDRRQFSYTTHVPERRSGKSRRNPTNR